MKLFRFGSIAVLSMLMAGVLAAQTPQTPPSPGTAQQPPATRPATQAPDAAEITIVGCLAPAAGDTDSYTLTVTPAGAAKGAASTAGAVADATRAGGTTAERGSDAARTGMTATAKSYKIVGLSDDQLKPHVNHQVELKGRVDASASTSGAASATPQEFRATAVKMVSATCPPAK